MKNKHLAALVNPVERSWPSLCMSSRLSGAKMATRQRWQGVGGRKWMDKLCHSTLPFGPELTAEGLMALSKIEGLVQDIS